MASDGQLTLVVKYDQRSRGFDLVSTRSSLTTPKVRKYPEDEDTTVVFHEENLSIGYLLWLCSTGKHPSFQALSERLERIAASHAPRPAAPAPVTLSFEAPNFEEDAA